MLRLHKGIDWSTYVQQRNLAKKENKSMEQYLDETLLDEDEE